MATEKATLSQQVFATLKARIIRWEYPPGHHLTEEALCREFGVSRIPVREALRMLAENDLVEQIPHRGSTVKQLDLAAIEDLYEVRLALECHVAAQLATMWTGTHLLAEAAHTWKADMQALIQAVEAGLTRVDGVQMAMADEAFHENLAQAAGNRAMAETLQAINERLRFTRVADIHNLTRLRQTREEHLAILQAIHRRDPDAARAAMQANIDGGRHSVRRALEEARTRSRQDS